LDDAGEYLVDPSDPLQRADLVLELFAEADALGAERARSVEVIYVEADDSWDDYDESGDEAFSLYEGLDDNALSDDFY
jgi:hypothetical protein